MLIPSERHTAADLALWADYEEADLIYGRRPQLPVKAQRSVNEIIDFARQGPCYASVSWGKDSVVLAHLCWRACRDWIGLVHLRAVPTANPHSNDVRDAFLRDYPMRYQEIAHHDAGIHLTPDEAKASKHSHFFALFRQVRPEFGTRYLSGVRAAESGARRMRMRSHGVATKNSCAPLGWWTDTDVFAYLAVNNLPVHPNYAMCGNGRWPRGRIRVSEVGGEAGREWGRREWEAEYYGDFLRRLEAGR